MDKVEPRELTAIRPEPAGALAERRAFWRGRRVLVTGHTGFIGGWLAHALALLEAKVAGYADAVPTEPSLFAATRLDEIIADHRGDIADWRRLDDIVARHDPSIVFHLAAQPLVRRAFRDPFETYRANVLGTVAMLEALRNGRSIELGVLMTTDKVYRNKEWPWAYREADELGGREPYGLSKAMAEMAISQYRDCYFSPGGRAAPRLVSVRAGNVIGGGDWSDDRLVPDAVRAWSRGQTLEVRSPHATRPWQHVLDVAHAMLLLAERSCAGTADLRPAYNIGPDPGSSVPVGALVEMLAASWGTDARYKFESGAAKVPESQLLSVDSSLLRSDLGWRPRLRLANAVQHTIEWYRVFLRDPAAARPITLEQITGFLDAAS